MLSYRHQFHAGGPADVLKHSILTLLILALTRKDKPLFVLDTHGGAGLYDLNDARANKTKEWSAGIGRIWGEPNIPESLSHYVDTVSSFNQSDLRWYPGSPLLIRKLLRPQDRLAVAELNKQDQSQLKANLSMAHKTEIIAGNGFHAVKAKLPPIEKRGLIFIDASFDQPDEFQRILQAVKNALRRFRTGTIAVWRPILDDDAMDAFDAGFIALSPPETIKLGLKLHKSYKPKRAQGSDLVIINPPYQLIENAEPMIGWLWDKLNQNSEGGPIKEMLVSE